MMIRQVTHGDFDNVIALLRQLWPDKRMQHRKLREVLERYVEESDYQIYGYDDGILLGIIALSLRWALFYEGRVATIEALVVDKDHTGKGIGSEVVRFVEDRMAEDGKVKGIELTSDLYREAAHEFWQECGYSKLAFQFRKEV